MAYLQALNGPNIGQNYELDAERCVLGRHPDCDVVIEVGAVSRHHAQIMREGKLFFLEDLNSRNGTYLNDRAIDRRSQLKDGDRLQVCDTTFTFVEPVLPPHAGDGRVGMGSGFTPVLVDDAEDGSTIMKTLDVSTRTGTVQLTATSEAKLKALLEITRNMSKALSLDAVLPQVIDSLFKIFVQADRGFIVLRTEEGALIPRWTKLRRDDTDEAPRISRTVVEKVMSGREAILSADAASDSRFQMSQSIADFRIRSIMCAPLIDTEGTVFGVLQVDTVDQRSKFQEDDLEVLASVASQAAVAIDNAQLHERALLQRETERELELAHQVQRGFLPEFPPDVPGYEFFDYYQAANKIGGDFYDYIELPDGRVAIIVADVVGHGVAAALLMAKLSAQVRFSLASDSDPAKALSQLNRTFTGGNHEGRFVTLVLVVLAPLTNEMSVAIAGHMPPLWRRGDEDVVDAGNEIASVPIGVLGDIQYEQVTLPFEPGQVVVLYTDGINESMNKAGKLFGIDRIRRRVASEKPFAGTLGRKIIADVRSFTANRPQYDDMCLVVVSRAAE